MLNISQVIRLSVFVSFFAALSASYAHPSCQCAGELRGKIKVWGKGKVVVGGIPFTANSRDPNEAEERDIIIHPDSSNMVRVRADAASGGGPGVYFIAKGCGWSLSAGAAYCGDCPEGSSEETPVECEPMQPYCPDPVPPESGILGYYCEEMWENSAPCPTQCITPICNPSSGDCPGGSSPCTPKPLNQDMEVTLTSSEEEDPGEMDGPGGMSSGAGDVNGPSSQPLVADTIRVAFNMGRSTVDFKMVGRAALLVKPEAFGSTPFSDPDAVSFEPEVRNEQGAQIAQISNAATGQKQIISAQVVVDKKLVGDDIVIRCYDRTGVALPAEPGELIPATSLAAARLRSTVTVKKATVTLQNLEGLADETFSGIQVLTQKEGQAGSSYELYSNPNSAGGGDSLEVRGNQASYVTVSPWQTDAGVTVRDEEIEEFRRHPGSSNFYKVGRTVNRYLKLEKLVAGERVDYSEPLISSIVGEGADVRQSHWFYDANPSSPLWGRLIAEVGSDGRWTRYIRDDFVPDVSNPPNPMLGRVKAIYRPWKNSGSGLLQTTEPGTILAQILAVQPDACLVEEFSYGPSFQGQQMYVRQMKALGNLIWREEKQSVVLIDNGTGETVKETWLRRFGPNGQLLSETRSATLHTADLVPGRQVYVVNADATRTTYLESTAAVGGQKQITTKVVNGTAGYPLGLPNQGQMVETVSLDGKTISSTQFIQTGTTLGSFVQVSQTTYSETTTAGVRVEREFQDGAETSTTRYLTDGSVENTDAAGVVTLTSRNEFTDMSTTIRDGGDNIPGFFSGTDLVSVDSTHPREMVGGVRPSGSLTRTTVTAGGVSRVTQESESNILGEQTRVKDAQGLVTQISRSKTASGWSETVAGPGVSSRTTSYYLDGRVRSITGTMVGEYYDYQYTSPQGYLVETVRYGAADSPRWKRRYSDAEGRLVREEQPAFGDLTGASFIWTEYVYNNRQQLVKIRRSGSFQGGQTLADEIVEYDSSGRTFRRGFDLNGNGVLDTLSQEPITETVSSYERSGQHWWQVDITRVYEKETANGFRESRRRTRLGSGYSTQTEVYEPGGAMTVVTSQVDRSQRKRTTVTQQAGSSQPGETVEINGLVRSQKTPQSRGLTTFSYSDFLETVTTETEEGDSLTRGYDNTGRLVSETTASGGTTRVVSYTYYPPEADWAGQLATRTAPFASKFGGQTSTASYTYDSFGRLVYQYGGAGGYPVSFTYNSYGERNTMSTFRGGGQTDVTTWQFDASSGLLQYKQDNIGARTQYGYHPGSSQVSIRTWAREPGGSALTTSYAYDALGQLTGKTYSDETPDVSVSFRRDGAASQVVDAAGTHVFGDWSLTGVAQSESVTGDEDDALAGLELRMPVDSLGRRLGHGGVLRPHRGSGAEQPLLLPSSRLAYGARGELSKIVSGTRSVTISHDPVTRQRVLSRHDAAASPALPWVTVESSSAAQGLHSIGHGRSDALKQQSRTVGTSGSPLTGVTIGAVDPDFGIGNYSGVSQWRYTYDEWGQVLKDEKMLTSDGSSFQVLAARSSVRSFSYAGGSPGDNSLNQMTGINRSGIWVDGLAQDVSNIQVNFEETTNMGHWFGRFVSSGDEPFWQRAMVTLSGGPDAANFQRDGYVYLPPTPEFFWYDRDGNLEWDARWTYEWDAENRLRSMTTKQRAIDGYVPELRLSFAYDAAGRRVRKKVEVKSGGVWTLKNDVRFVYDGWNLVAEVEYHSGASDAPAVGSGQGTRAYVRRSYVWGPDVTGTAEGAGGVGGLLMLTRHERGSKAAESYWVNMDLNGNVIGLTSTTQDGRYAVYDYDAFGKCIRANEPEAGLNPVRFSSKYTDEETGLVYYGYRYYSPEMGRWISRDPIEEEGGINLYGMVGNDPVCKWDYLGNSVGVSVPGSPYPWASGSYRTDIDGFSADQLRDLKSLSFTAIARASAIQLSANKVKNNLIKLYGSLSTDSEYLKIVQEAVVAIGGVELIAEKVASSSPHDYRFINATGRNRDARDTVQAYTRPLSGFNNGFFGKKTIWIVKYPTTVSILVHEMAHLTLLVPREKDNTSGPVSDMPWSGYTYSMLSDGITYHLLLRTWQSRHHADELLWGLDACGFLEATNHTYRYK